jgi:peptidoglycan/LPS O-acetylase OafA/YrhL
MVGRARQLASSDRISTTRSQQAQSRVPALDGVRGIAISLVLIRHAWPSVFGDAGFIGVELFFVLSGYLITGILLRDYRSGDMSYRNFYINRFLRLIPALIVMVGTVVVVVVTINPLGDRQFLVPGAVTALTYTSDLPDWPLHELTDITHLWTLAIEEQFYVVWPMLMLGFAARGRLRQVVWIALGVSLAALLGSVAYGSHADEMISLYTWVTPWTISLVLGCALAAGVLRFRVNPKVAGVILVTLLGATLLPEAKSHAWGYLALIPVAGVLSVGLIANAAGPQPIGILTNPALRYMGKISYAAYLWDYPLAQWFSGIIAIPMVIVISSLSYRLIEQPFLRLKRRGVPEGSPRTGLLAVAVDIGDGAVGTAAEANTLP